eukprot:scaffold13889_cov178-Amphora_coffeaeformis.AAC.6
MYRGGVFCEPGSCHDIDCWCACCLATLDLVSPSKTVDAFALLLTLVLCIDVMSSELHPSIDFWRYYGIGRVGKRIKSISDLHIFPHAPEDKTTSWRRRKNEHEVVSKKEKALSRLLIIIIRKK